MLSASHYWNLRLLGDGDLEAVKKFIEEKGISVNAQDEFGYSAL